MTTPDPKVPGKSAPADKPAEETVADATKSAADKAANEVTGIREEFRAIRSDADVQKVASEAKPFIEGAALTALMVVDPAIGLAYGAYKGARFVQGVRERRAAAKGTVTHTDES